MGMFDTIKCRYKLPYTIKQTADLTLLRESATTQDEFQTKCLECWMNNYMIDSSGKLLVSTDNTNKPYKKYKYTGEIEMYNYLTSDHLRYDLDYRWRIKFKNGVVSKCKLLHMKRQDNSMRKNAENMFKQHRQMMTDRVKTTRWKIYQACWRGPVAKMFSLYRFCTKKLPNSIWLESKLKFWG